MLCTFTVYAAHTDIETGQVVDTEHQNLTLVIRSEDIRQIADGTDGTTLLGWVINDKFVTSRIVGTAKENMERLQREELEAITRVNTFQQNQQQRMEQGYPVAPVGRGKAGRK